MCRGAKFACVELAGKRLAVSLEGSHGILLRTLMLVCQRVTGQVGEVSGATIEAQPRCRTTLGLLDLSLDPVNSIGIFDRLFGCRTVSLKAGAQTGGPRAT